MPLTLTEPLMNLLKNKGSNEICGSLNQTEGKMVSKPRKSLIASPLIVGILSRAGNQAFEGITWPIGFLFRGIFLAMTLLATV
jgi:hypothetical protein